MDSQGKIHEKDLLRSYFEPLQFSSVGAVEVIQPIPMRNMLKNLYGSGMDQKVLALLIHCVWEHSLFLFRLTPSELIKMSEESPYFQSPLTTQQGNYYFGNLLEKKMIQKANFSYPKSPLLYEFTHPKLTHFFKMLLGDLPKNIFKKRLEEKLILLKQKIEYTSREALELDMERQESSNAAHVTEKAVEKATECGKLKKKFEKLEWLFLTLFNQES